MREAIRRNFRIETFTHCLFPRNQWPPKVWSHDLAYWTTEGKFVTAAYGLRNRMSILVETPGDPRFERKIYAHYALVSELLEYTNQHGREMQEVCRAADREVVERIKTRAASGSLRNFVAGKYESWGKIDLLAYPENVYEYIPGTSVQRKKPGTLEGPPQVITDVEHLTKPVGTAEATVPRGYLIAAGLDHIVDKLRLQNIAVEILKSPITVRGEEFAVDKIVPVRRGGYAMTDLKGEFIRIESRTFPAGTYRVDLAQPHANLAFYCLEPEVGDGLAGWGFFNDALKSLGAEKARVTFPVFKYFEVIEESR
jgi:dipeptidyl-peptidase-4